jgi:hypothetical protein
MLLSEDDGVEEALLRYAQQEAAQWGAGRFAAEFDRRDEEERRLKDAEAGIFFRYPGMTYPGDAPPPEMMSGPVDQAVHDRVVEAVAGESDDIRKPNPIRHAHVPRPPAPEGESGRRRGRGPRRERLASGSSRMPSAAELARMSPAGRRLYGFDDDRRHPGSSS